MNEDKLKEITESFRKASESYSIALKRAQKLVDSINLEHNTFNQLLKSVAFNYVKTPFFNNVLTMSNLAKSLQKLSSLMANSLRNLDLTSHKFNRVMVAIGWMPVDLIYMEEVNKIIELYDEKGIEAKSEIEEILIQNYDNETIEQILGSWEKYEWLSHRFRLMSIGVKAHMRGEYALSIPQLMTHVEGIVRDYFQYDTRVHQSVIKEDAKRIIYGFDEDAENQTWLSYEFNRATFEFYKKHIMAGFTDRPKSEISRHAIFHGVDLDYDNVCNSLKIILLLDHMIAQINEMKKIEENEVS